MTCRVVLDFSLERGFRYFKVSPIKAFRDISHVSVDKVSATGRYTVLDEGTLSFRLLGTRQQ